MDKIKKLMVETYKEAFKHGYNFVLEALEAKPPDMPIKEAIDSMRKILAEKWSAK